MQWSDHISRHTAWKLNCEAILQCTMVHCPTLLPLIKFHRLPKELWEDLKAFIYAFTSDKPNQSLG